MEMRWETEDEDKANSRLRNLAGSTSNGGVVILLLRQVWFHFGFTAVTCLQVYVKVSALDLIIILATNKTLNFE